MNRNKQMSELYTFVLKAVLFSLFAFFIFSNICTANGEEAREKTITNSFGMEFVYIPPGTFIMGSPEDEPGRFDGETQHQVTLTQGFYMQTTEMTQGQWKTVMGNNIAWFNNCGDDCPADNVSWFDVKNFIDELNTRNEGTYRLPTEAEWEYAARSGTETAFASGEITETEDGHDPNLDSMGWYIYNSGYEPQPVAQKKPNAWGLYDMHGNVWEWVSDWYGDYPDSEVTDPKGPSSGEFRVLRGGCWANLARGCRSANRYKYDPEKRIYYIGFRLVRIPDHQ